jgi:hypothetical protein
MPGHLAGEEKRGEERRREEKRGEETRREEKREERRREERGEERREEKRGEERRSKGCNQEGLQVDQHSRAACVRKLLWRTGKGAPVSRTRRCAFLVLGAWHGAWYLLDSTPVMAIMIIATQHPPDYRVAKNTSLGSLLPATGTGL